MANYDGTSYSPEVSYSGQATVVELLGMTFRLKPYRFATKEDPEDFRLSIRDGSWVSSDRPTNWRLSSGYIPDARA